MEDTIYFLRLYNLIYVIAPENLRKSEPCIIILIPNPWERHSFGPRLVQDHINYNKSTISDWGIYKATKQKYSCLEPPL